MKEAMLKGIERGDKAGLYTISFAGEDVSEFEKFLAEFRSIARYNEDFNTVMIERCVITGIDKAVFRL